MTTVPPPAPSPAPAAPDDDVANQRSRSRVAIIAALVVVVVAVAAVVIAVATSSGDDGGSGDAAQWNTVAAFDYETGDVILFEGADEVDRIETGTVSPVLFQLSPTVLAVAGSDEVVFVDITTGATTAAPVPDDSDPRPIASADVPVLVAGNNSWGPASLIASDGTTLEIAEMAGWDEPLIDPNNVVVSPDGTRFALTNFSDRSGSSTAVVSFDDADSAVVVPGHAVAVTDETVTTFVNTDRQGRFVSYDVDGDPIGEVETDRIATAMQGAGGDVITIGEDGTLTRLSPAESASEAIGQLDLASPPGMRATTRGEEATIVFATEASNGSNEAWVVAASGEFHGPIEVEGAMRRITIGRSGDDCAAVVTESSVTLIDLVSGEAEVADLSSDDPSLSHAVGSVDMCTVVPIGRNADAVVTPDGVERLAEGERVIAVSPDGEQVAVHAREGDGGGAVTLRSTSSLGGDDALVTSLGDLRAAVFFVER